MIVQTGRFAGYLVEQLLLLEPAFIGDLLQAPEGDGEERSIRREARKLVKRFDSLRLHTACEECGAQAMFLTLTHKSLVVECWCPMHTPRSHHGGAKSFQYVTPFLSAIRAVAEKHGGDAAVCRQIIRSIAAHKGLPDGRVTRERALDFFWGESVTEKVEA